MSFGDAIADDQSKQVSAADAEKAPDGGPDKPLKADGAELPFEQDDCCSDQSARPGRTQGREAERANFEAGKSYNGNKKKTYENKIHGKPPRGCSLPICP